jgi:precorrin-2 dehydrogenase/sirohydrochlorin ferrochelatase
MRYLPILVDLAGRRCLVVGGGAVAARKAETLLAADARVTVVAPEIGDELTRLAARDVRVALERRPYRHGDLDGAALAFAATDDPDVQERVSRDGRASGVLVNAVDEPERCSFVMPAVLDRDPLLVAVSTSGASPALARRIRDDLAAALGPEYDAAVRHLAALRARYRPGRPRQQAFVELVSGGLIEALRASDDERVRVLTHGACGALEAASGDERAG